MHCCRRSSLDYPIHRFTALASLTPREMKLLQSLGEPPVKHRRSETLRQEGQVTNCVYLLLDGWVISSILLPEGSRQITKVHLPGDMLGTPSMVLPAAADTLTALTDCVTARVTYERLGQLFATEPRLTALFIMAVQLERLALMDTLTAMGNAHARQQLAVFLLDLHRRLAALGAVKGDAFDLPLTQELIGDLLGLTNVHINRSLRAMEEDGLIARQGQRIRLADMAALRRLSPLPVRQPQFAPDWLPPVKD
jgi:CRP/FNR family transcriptional regulator, anaerobic regulatory protein